MSFEEFMVWLVFIVVMVGSAFGMAIFIRLVGGERREARRSGLTVERLEQDTLKRVLIILGIYVCVYAVLCVLLFYYIV